jgi:hypothetical protein
MDLYALYAGYDLICIDSKTFPLRGMHYIMFWFKSISKWLLNNETKKETFAVIKHYICLNQQGLYMPGF